jgi:hypothetical protein
MTVDDVGQRGVEQWQDSVGTMERAGMKVYRQVDGGWAGRSSAVRQADSAKDLLLVVHVNVAGQREAEEAHGLSWRWIKRITRDLRSRRASGSGAGALRRGIVAAAWAAA